MLLHFLFPAMGLLLAALLPWRAARTRLPLLVSLADLAVLLSQWGHPGPFLGAWLSLDALAAWILLVIDVLMVLCAWYVPAYLALRKDRNDRILLMCLCAFCGLSAGVVTAQHLGLLWVMMETTTLATAPMVFFNRTPRSIEAAWKYLLIGSVGVALALMGTVSLSFAAHQAGMKEPLFIHGLISASDSLSAPWVRVGFVLLLVGYGTKMGLAPLHSWKPDAYGEAPGLVGAVLAGGVTSCAVACLLRAGSIVFPGSQGPFARELLIGFGVLSLVWAMVFLVRQADLKRLLAYSSVEHMGIIALGIGVGGAAARFALYHLAANALVKCALFLSVGNIHRAYLTQLLPEVTGAVRRLPVSGWSFLIAFLAITALPPFAPFYSEFGLILTLLGGGRWILGSIFLVTLAVIFLGMSASVLRAVQGPSNAEPKEAPFRDRFGTTAPILTALALALLLGLWLPEPLASVLSQASQAVGGLP